MTINETKLQTAAAVLAFAGFQPPKNQPQKDFIKKRFTSEPKSEKAEITNAK